MGRGNDVNLVQPKSVSQLDDANIDGHRFCLTRLFFFFFLFFGGGPEDQLKNTIAAPLLTKYSWSDHSRAAFPGYFRSLVHVTG